MAIISGSRVTGFRAALEIADRRGELVRITKPVDPGLEAPSIIAAMSKLPSSPAILFENVSGFPGVRGSGGLLAHLPRVAELLGLSAETVTRKQNYLDALDNPIKPMIVSTGPCKENIVKTNIDIGKLIFPTRGAENVTHEYYQPVVILKNPNTGQINASVYRACIQGPDTVTVNIRWNQHGGLLLSMAKELGVSFPVALCIGVDPAIYIAAVSKLPLGYNELGFASGLMGRPLELVRCETVDLAVPADTEVVIEGEIRPPYRLGDDGPWPEYLGYLGMNIHPPIMDITAVTYRNNPINSLQVPGTKHIVGLGTEAQFYRHLKAFAGDFVVDTYTGRPEKHRVVVKVKKTEAHHEGLQINVAYAALGYDATVDIVVLVDEDVNIYDEEHIWWAINSRCNPAKQVHVLPEARTHQNCPIAGVREMFKEPIVKGKMIIDATIPWNYRILEKSPGITYFTQSSWPKVDLKEVLDEKDYAKWVR